MSFWLVANRQYVMDTVRFWSFEPTSEIASIASKINFTDSGKFLFYASQPAVENSEPFNANCNRKEQNTAVIGCYVNDNIYVYNVTDQRLEGIKEVTSAHEMLHAAYQRLDDAERARINKLVEEEYAKLINDPAYSERMAFYARTEPGERDNELHSIIGSELSNISPELETHYAKYFTDRTKIVAYYKAYNGTFEQLKARAAQLAAQLDALSKKIEADKTAYSNEVNQLNSDIEQFKRRAASGGFSSAAEQNSELRALQSRINAANTKRTTVIAAINSEIDQFNSLLKEYNENQVETQDLFKSIDSSVAPAPQVDAT